MSFSLIKERRIGNISRIFVPFVKITSSCIEILPSLASLKNVFIDSLKHFRLNNSTRYFLNLVSRGPDITKEYIYAIFALSNCFFFKINVNSACECICYN
jgi:hypothetical protein